MEELEGYVCSNDLHHNVCSVPGSLQRGLRAELGAAEPDSKSGAAAAGRVDVVSGAGGARYPGPAGPDPGRGEHFTSKSKGFRSSKMT